MSSKSTFPIPKLTIGMPVYNGKKFLKKRLDSLLTQTFTDFELIISDDASTDSTPLICKEYAKKDKRIHFIQQKKNMGHIYNYNFVLQGAKSKYFAWAAQDDIISPTYLEKNIQILESNKNIVGSISKMEIFSLPDDNLKINPTDMKFKNFIKRLSAFAAPLDLYSMIGSYDRKIRIFLKKTSAQMKFAVFRTSELQKSIPKENFFRSELILFFNLLKYGDIHIIDEVLMYRYDHGFSNKGFIKNMRLYDLGLFTLIFSSLPFTFWCMKNLNFKIFVKNLDYFIMLSFKSGVLILIDLARIFTHMIFRAKNK